MIDFIRGILFVAVSSLCTYGCWHTTDMATKIDLLSSMGLNITVYMFALHAKTVLIAKSK